MYGHDGLLNMGGESDDMTNDRRQKRFQQQNFSDYNKIAQQGGHKDLLKIEGDQTPARSPNHKKNAKNEKLRKCGDWYNSNNNNSSKNESNVETPPPKDNTLKATSSEYNPAQIRDQRRSQGNCIVPADGPEELPRSGKKRFDSGIIQEAPFATNF